MHLPVLQQLAQLWPTEYHALNEIYFLISTKWRGHAHHGAWRGTLPDHDQLTSLLDTYVFRGTTKILKVTMNVPSKEAGSKRTGNLDPKSHSCRPAQ